MNRRSLVALLAVVIVAGCGSSSSPTAPASATSSPTLAATTIPTPTPSPTPEPAKTVADLIADPLPTMQYADVAALDPTNASGLEAIQKFVASVDEQSPNENLSPGLATSAFMCGAHFKQAVTAERLALREVHCLLLATTAWLGYVSAPGDETFAKARTAYAFAASSLGADGRGWLDAALQRSMPEVGAQPSTAPSPSGVRSGKELLAVKISHVDPSGLAVAIRDAVATDPVTAARAYWWMVVGVGSKTLKDSDGYPYELPKSIAVDSPIEICAHGYPGAFNMWQAGSKYDLDMQDGCGFLVVQMFKAYRSTGLAADWDAAVFALRMGIQGAPPCAKLGVLGNGCPEEWLSLMDGFLGG